jgi:hypothetical protein
MTSQSMLAPLPQAPAHSDLGILPGMGRLVWRQATQVSLAQHAVPWHSSGTHRVQALATLLGVDSLN